MIRLRLVFLLFFLIAFGIVAAVSGSGYATAEPGEHANSESSEALLTTYIPLIATTPALTHCRYGVNNRPGLPGNQWMTVVGAGYYINFKAGPVGQPVPDSVQLMPQIRLRQDRQGSEFFPSYTVEPPLTMDEDGLGPIILSNLGGLWLVGNEPEVADSVQDHMLPEMYAQAYHDVYHFIKQLDPYAHVAIAGLSMITPGRLQYLDIVWDTYLQEYGEPMPVDVWNMHLYILSEIRPWDNGPSDGRIALGTDPNLAIKAPWGPPEIECPKDDVYCRAEHDSPAIFREQIIDMRTWMKNHGQQNRPLILSEFSVLYPFVDYDDPVNPTECYLMDELGQCFTEQRVSSYLEETLDFLETANDSNLGYPADDYNLVQQWAWYGMWTEPEMAGASSNLLVQNYKDFAPDAPTALTKSGTAFRDRVFGKEINPDLVAGVAKDVLEQATQPGATADVELSVGFSNDGFGIIVDPFMVTFYADAALTQEIGETQVEPGWTGLINGCAWGRITEWASIAWSDVPVGIHTYWVKIDSHNDIGDEIDEKNNILSGQVTVTP